MAGVSTSGPLFRHTILKIFLNIALYVVFDTFFLKNPFFHITQMYFLIFGSISGV